jgi:hypothetical protein
MIILNMARPKENVSGRGNQRTYNKALLGVTKRGLTGPYRRMNERKAPGNGCQASPTNPGPGADSSLRWLHPKLILPLKPASHTAYPSSCRVITSRTGPYLCLSPHIEPCPYTRMADGFFDCGRHQAVSCGRTKKLGKRRPPTNRASSVDLISD